MNKSIIAVAVAAAFACMGAAQAFEMGPYVGVKSGVSHLDVSKKDITIEGLNKPEHAINDSSLYSYTGGVFAGYNFNPYFGVEFGYDYLGTFDMDFGADNMGSHDFTVNALQLSLRGAYPITSSFSVTGTVGALQWFNDAWDYDRHGDGASEDSHSSMSPVVGAGFEYAFNRNWVARFDYQYIHRVGSRRDNGFTPDISTYNVGLEYVFGSEPAPVEPAPAPVQKETVSEDHSLSSDVLFDFGKSTLKPEGKAALDKFYADYQAENLENSHLTISGYTDRIGSDASNQKLSEARANSVASYLQSLGMSADDISVVGYGESNPVSGTNCDGIKDRKALIKCLGVDRRVEINVTGVKTTVIEK